MNQARTWLLVVAGLAVPAGIGCSKAEKPPLPVPVAGVVTYNGKPLDGAQVSFISTDARSGHIASGFTDDQGKFQLQTFVGGYRQTAGAIPGTYKVAIRKRGPRNDAPSGDADDSTSGQSTAPQSPAPQSPAPQPSDTPKPSVDETVVPAGTAAPESAGAETTEPAPRRAGPPNAVGDGPAQRRMPTPPQDKSLIPEKYENSDDSGLTALVKPEGNEPFQFDLTDE